jgi:pimeloyl-ACP methyl ester carboxylesterase
MPDAPAIRHGHADLGDVRLHYVTAGEGPAVVLLHGWPQTWHMWRGVIPGLAARHRVVAPDLRGLGDSSRPEGGYDKKTLANDVWRLAHEVLGEERLFVVGHDWGGPVAFALAAQHRDGVRRMAIFDVPVPGDGTPVMFNNRWHHGLHWERDLPEELTAGREDVYLRFFYRTWGARPDAIAEEAQQEYLRAYRQPGAMRAGFELYRATPRDAARRRRQRGLPRAGRQAADAGPLLRRPVGARTRHGGHRELAARGGGLCCSFSM